MKYKVLFFSPLGLIPAGQSAVAADMPEADGLKVWSSTRLDNVQLPRPFAKESEVTAAGWQAEKLAAGPEIICSSKKPADLRPVGKIEFDCSEAEREISCLRGQLNNNGKEHRNAKE